MNVKLCKKFCRLIHRNWVIFKNCSVWINRFWRKWNAHEVLPLSLKVHTELLWSTMSELEDNESYQMSSQFICHRRLWNSILSQAKHLGRTDHLPVLDVCFNDNSCRFSILNAFCCLLHYFILYHGITFPVYATTRPMEQTCVRLLDKLNYKRLAASLYATNEFFVRIIPDCLLMLTSQDSYFPQLD